MGKIRNIATLPRIYFNIVDSLKKQKQFLKLNIAPLLEKSMAENDGSLSDKDFIKINNYYGLAVPSILGEAFCALRGKDMTIEERWTSTSQGIITGIFDDFLDDHKLPEEYIEQMVKHPEVIEPKSSNELLFINFYMMALDKASNPEFITKQFVKVHKAQIESIEQEVIGISEKRVWEITSHKGGDSVLFYREGFGNNMVDGEKETMFQLGTLMQYENDIFDVYKDNKSGIKTIPTTVNKVSELRNRYLHEMDLFIGLCHRMNYPDNNIRLFLNRVMPVINRGFVCLDQYQKLEEVNNGNFSIDSFTRKQLICDMEKPKNILKTFYYQIANTY